MPVMWCLLVGLQLSVRTWDERLMTADRLFRRRQAVQVLHPGVPIWGRRSSGSGLYLLCNLYLLIRVCVGIRYEDAFLCSLLTASEIDV